MKPLIKRALAICLLASACTASSPAPEVEISLGREQPLKSRLLPGGRYDISVGRTKAGRPFEIKTLKVTIEVRNNTEAELVPECALWFGSQVVRVDIGGQALAPGARVYLSGRSEFPRPLDDYESGDAGCYTRLRGETVREMQREQRQLAMDRPTRVPDLVGRELDSMLPSFRRGLDIRIVTELTPCAEPKLMKMSRYLNPFGKPLCGGPVVSAQEPQARAKARVGDVIEVVVSSSS